MPDYSSVARHYRSSRPRYPVELFSYLAAHAPARGTAWDCATGSGQAARGLVDHFERVIATDMNEAQLAEAEGHPRISYRVATAEGSGLESASVDLVTVAAAVHWFDQHRFFREALRVLKPRGILAAWTYHVGYPGPPFDEPFGRFYREVVAPFFDAGARQVDARYADLDLPGTPLEPPTFRARAAWTLTEALSFVRSWSGTAAYREAQGVDPVALLEPELTDLYGDPARVLEVSFPLYLRVSRVPGS